MKKLILVIAVIALIAVLGTVLFACVPSSLSKARLRLEKKGYKVQYADINDRDLDEDEYDWMKEYGVVGWVEARKNNERLEAILFDSKEKAKSYYAEAKSDFEDMVREYEREGESYYKEFTMVRKGKWVIDGTQTAIKDFK